MIRRIVVAGAVLLTAFAAQAADDLMPAVNTSAPDRAATPERAAATPAAAPAAAAKPAASGVRQPASVPAAATRNTGAPGSSGNATGGSARDRVELENTQITGNRELPKVMYVVPWKKPDLGDFGGRPARSLLDEALEPVDRDVFRRQNRYFEALQPDAPVPRSGDEK